MSGPKRGAAPSVTVVVTACSVDRGLGETLTAVAAQAQPLGAESLLVFNCAESALPAEDVRSMAEIVDRVLFVEEPGKSNALNAAARASDADVLAFTDDDAMPRPGWLEALIDPFGADSELAGVGGPVVPVFPDGPPPRWYRQLVSNKSTHFLGPKHDLGPEPIEYELPLGDSVSPVPLGANCAWSRTWLERFPYRPELGPNRATGMRGGEDTCLAIEVMQAGGCVRYAPDAIVEHPVTPERLTQKYVIDGFQVQGSELPVIMEQLGRKISNPKRFEKAIRRRDPMPLQRWLLGDYKLVKRRARRAYAEAILSKLASM
ncbi:MAG: glycosyltransferase [Planctomycetota bacterium]